MLLRIAKGVSQEELAKRMGYAITMVSRDEGRDYKGATLRRAKKVLVELGVPAMCTITPKD